MGCLCGYLGGVSGFIVVVVSQGCLGGILYVSWACLSVSYEDCFVCVLGTFWAFLRGVLACFASGVSCWCFMVFFGIAISGVYLGVPWMFWG